MLIRNEFKQERMMTVKGIFFSFITALFKFFLGEIVANFPEQSS